MSTNNVNNASNWRIILYANKAEASGSTSAYHRQCKIFSPRRDGLNKLPDTFTVIGYKPYAITGLFILFIKLYCISALPYWWTYSNPSVSWNPKPGFEKWDQVCMP